MKNRILSVIMVLVVVTSLWSVVLPATSVLGAWPSDPTVNVPICTADNNQDEVRMTTDGAGGAIIAWQDKRNGTDFDIYAQRINAAGVVQWTPANGVAICTRENDQMIFGLSSDGSGGAYIMWQDGRTGAAGGDIYVQRINSSGVLQWTPADGVMVCNAGDEQSSPRMSTYGTGGSGGIIVAWQDKRDSATNGGKYDIYAQKIDINGATKWAENGVVICNETNDQKSPRTTGDGAGGLIIHWQDFRTNPNGDLYAQKINASGALQWTSPPGGVLVSNTIASDYHVSMAGDGAGGAVLVWRDSRNNATSGSDIYAQRLNSADGSLAWGAGVGIPICTEAGEQGWPVVAMPAFSGTTVVAWRDARTSGSTSNDIYAQKLDLTTGALQWTPASGVPVCTTTHSQENPKITSDGSGGAIIAWEDAATAGTPPYDIYAQKLDPTTGARRWAVDGVAVSTATYSQKKPNLTSDTAGGAIIAWTDYRPGINPPITDVYAQRVFADSSLTPGPVSFEISGITGPVTADTPFEIIVTAKQSGATKTDYTGTIHFTSSDSQVEAGNGLPGDYQFLTSDQGDIHFTVTLKTAGSQTITIWDDTDIVHTTSTSAPITVNAGGGDSPWTAMTSNTTGNLGGVWGSSASDAFAVGWTGDGQATPYNSVILHWDGSNWSAIDGGTTNPLHAVWGSSSIDVFAVGHNGTILRYNGFWYAMTSGLSYERLNGIWGSSGSDVFAVGQAGIILHYNGSAWSPMTSGTSYELHHVWGTSGSDVYAVGDNGTILHYNGSIWSPMTSNTSSNLGRIWGSSASNVFALGGSTILRYSNSAWSPMTSNTTNNLNGIWGSSASDVFAIGDSGTILHCDGSAWTPMNSNIAQPLYNIWGMSASNVFAVGANGTIIHYGTGGNASGGCASSSWTAMTSNTNNNLTSVWGSSSCDVYAAGSSNTLMHYTGGAWSPVSMGSLTSLGFSGIWGSSASDVYAVGAGAGSYFAARHYGGSGWADTTISGVPQGIWGSSASDIFIVGASTSIWHYNGTDWSGIPRGEIPDDMTLYGIWGSSPTEAYAVGGSGAGNGVISHYNGTTWTTVGYPIGRLYHVWGTSATNVFAVGDYGTIRRWNGITWTTMTSNTTNHLYGIWGTSGTDIYAVGANGTVLHYNGTIWSVMDSGTTGNLLSVWGSSACDVYAVGEIYDAGANHSVILHYGTGECTPLYPGIISGYVYEANSNPPVPIVGAEVTASVNSIEGLQQVLEGTPAGQAITDGNGLYTISGLEAGDYVISAWAENHERRYYSDTIYLKQAQAISVSAGQTISGKNINLGPGGTISGNVTDQGTGEPIPQVSVTAGPPQGFTVAFTLTDENGDYTLEGVPYGSYYVSSPFARRLGSGDPNYVMEFWQEKTLNNTPDTVTVEAGDNANHTGIDFTLTQGGTISGHVRQSNGTTPIPNAQVLAVSHSSLTGPWVNVGMGFTDEEGYYITTGLPPGTYGIRATASTYANEWYNNTPFKQDATAVTVTLLTDTPDKDFTLDSGGSISGKITADGGGNIANCHVHANDSATDKWVAGVNTGSDGTYTLSGLPAGSYELKACATCNGLSYVDEWYDNVYKDTQATAIPVSAGQSITGKNFTLGAGGTISGRVTDQNGQTITTDTSVGSIELTTGWHKFVYRVEELWGGSVARVAFKAPGNTDWRWFSTTEHTKMRVSPDLSAQSGLTLVTKKNTWSNHPKNHQELVKCVDQDATQEAGWYGQSVVSIINQEENIHGNDDYFTSYYEAYIDCDVPGTWQFSTDSDDASEIVIDDQVVASWYDGHGAAGRWERKIRIDITDNATGENIKGITTNLDGTYSISGLPAGTLKLNARAPGYVDEAQTVVLSDGETKPDINFTLEAGGTISGTVREAGTNNPLSGVKISVYQYDAPSGKWFNRGSGTTDSQGYYLTSPLPAATDYYLRTSMPRYFSEWYDGVLDSDVATKVSVTALSNTPNKNFTLDKGGFISGHVYQPNGSTGISGARIEVIEYASLSSYWVTQGWGNTDSQGYYETTGLSTGNYALRVTASGYATEFYDNIYFRSQAASLSVTSPNELVNKNFTLAQSGTISGTVTADVGGGAIADCHIQVFDVPTGEWTAGTNTNSQGQYTISGLPAGDYHLRACPTCDGLNYLDEWYDNVSDPNAPRPIITLTAGQTMSGKNFSLAAAGSISGKVTSTASGDAISGISVRAIEYSSIIGKWVERGSKTTDSEGNYKITGLAAGDYGVRAEVPGLVDVWYANEWYDNAYYQREADPVTVVLSQDKPGINFSLEGGGSISGTVTASGGGTIANLHLYATDYTTNEWIAGTNTRNDGTYTLSGLLPGNYRVKACATCSGLNYIDEYYDNSDYNAAQSINVAAGQDTSGKNFSLAAAGSISGKVTSTATGDAISGISVRAIEYSSLTGKWVERGSDTTDSEGNYKIIGLTAGDYGVRAELPGLVDVWYANEWYDNAYYKSEADPVTVVISQDKPGINFSLEPGGSISGTVTASGGGTIANLHLYATDYTTNDWIAGTNTRNDGTYTLSGLLPGNYRVKACATCSNLNYFDEWYDGVTSQSGATAVTVTASQDTPNKNFSLDAFGTISGVVKHTAGNLLANVSVEARRTDDPKNWKGATTNTDGQYTISGLSFGDYYVRSPAGTHWGDGDDNFVIEYYNNKTGIADTSADTVNVSAETPNRDGIDFTLDVGGSISGNVKKSSDNTTPIVNMHLYAIDSTTKIWISGDDTDSNGNYTIHGLPNGSYFVRACASCSSMYFVDEWWDNASTQSGATAIPATVAVDTPGKNFLLDAAGSVSGYVRTSGGTAISGASVYPFTWSSLTAGPWAYPNWTTTDSNGYYKIYSLPPGDYAIRASATGYATEWYNNKYFPTLGSSYNADKVTVVASQNQGGKDFSLESGGSISGYVKTGATPISGASISIFNFSDSGSYGSVSTDTNGYYQFKGLASGQYTVRVQATGKAREWYSATSGEVYTKEQATAVVVTAPTDTGNINFDLVPGGTVSGRVTSTATGNGIYNASIRLLDSEGRVAVGSRTDSDGNYATSGVIGGEYTVSVEATGYITEWYDGVYNEEQAEAILVTAGQDNPNKDFSLEQTGTVTTVYVSPATQEVSPGETFTVEIKVDPTVAIAGVQFDLSFDKALLTLNNVTEGNLLSQNGASTYFAKMNTVANANTTGTIQVTGVILGANETVSSPGTFAVVSFTAKTTETGGTSALHLSNVKVGDENADPVPAMLTDGSVSVIPYDDWDVNCDNKVDVFDMILIGQNWGKTGAPHWIRADVKRDGIIDVFDMILIGQHWTG